MIEAHMDFGIKVERAIALDGFSLSDFPEEMRSNAMHCLVVLLGGKRLIVNPSAQHHHITVAHLYLDEKLRGPVPPVGMEMVPGTNDTRLEVGTYFRSLRTSAFAVDEVKLMLNGAKRG
jgi:hypothetical protein